MFIFVMTAFAGFGQMKEIEIKVTAFPNPVINELYISVSEKVLKVTVVNTEGQVIITQTEDNKDIMIDTSALAKGVYIVSIETTTNKKTVKIIKN